MSISGLDPLSPASGGQAGLGDDELRALKVALKACFPNLDGLIEKGTGNGGPTAAEFTALFDDVATLQGGSSGLIPVGAIVMWSGTVASIPSGWALCDGSTANGFVTPDLRDRFVVGAGGLADGSEFDPKNTGGNAISGGDMATSTGGSGTASGSISIPDHTLTLDNLPEHSHLMFADEENNGSNNPPASNKATPRLYNNGSTAQNYTMQGSASTATEATLGKTSKAGASGSPDALTHDGATIEITEISHSHDYMPAYYAVAFIAFVDVP